MPDIKVMDLDPIFMSPLYRTEMGNFIREVVWTSTIWASFGAAQIPSI
jgi:hypothetical protein